MWEGTLLIQRFLLGRRLVFALGNLQVLTVLTDLELCLASTGLSDTAVLPTTLLSLAIGDCHYEHRSSKAPVP